MNPIELFNNWYQQEKEKFVYKLPSARCFSTVGLDGFSNARFVSLKEVKAGGFIVTGPLLSRKGLEISNDNRAALTFWWSATEKQVRIQGTLTPITSQDADRYFAERNRDSQLVSLISQQGAEIDNPDNLNHEFDELQKKRKGRPIERPLNWGGFYLDPLRVEFLEFKDTRFHNRVLYSRKSVNDFWETTYLQP